MKIPEKFDGMKVIRRAWIAPDRSEKPYQAIIIAHAVKKLADPAASYSVIDICSKENDDWFSVTGRHDLTLQRAEEHFNARVKKRSRITERVMERDFSWGAVTLFKWDFVPVDGRDEFKHDARYLAGKARDLPEFYRPENRETQREIEAWLSRHSEANRHPDTRS